MEVNYDELEKLYLTDKEIEFIKQTIIDPNITKAETRDMLSWRGTLERDILLKKTTDPKDIEQYERLREIEYLFKILKNEYSKSIIEFGEKIELMDQIEETFETRLMLEDLTIEMKGAFDQKDLENLLVEAYDQNLEEPYIQELIKQLMEERYKEQEFIKLERLINAAGFKHIDGKMLLSISALVLKEYKKAAENNQSLFIARQGLDRSKCAYLLIKNLRHVPFHLGDENNRKKKNNLKKAYTRNAKIIYAF